MKDEGFFADGKQLTTRHSLPLFHSVYSSVSSLSFCLCYSGATNPKKNTAGPNARTVQRDGAHVTPCLRRMLRSIFLLRMLQIDKSSLQSGKQFPLPLERVAVSLAPVAQSSREECFVFFPPLCCFNHAVNSRARLGFACRKSELWGLCPEPNQSKTALSICHRLFREIRVTIERRIVLRIINVSGL